MNSIGALICLNLFGYYFKHKLPENGNKSNRVQIKFIIDFHLPLLITIKNASM